MIGLALVLAFGALLTVHFKYQRFQTGYQFDHRGGYLLDLGTYPPPFVNLQLKGDGEGKSTYLLTYSCLPYAEKNGSTITSGELRLLEGQLTREETEEFLDYLYAHDLFQRVPPGPSASPGERRGSVRVLSTPSFARSLPAEEVEKLLAEAPVVGERTRRALAASKLCPLHRFDELAVEGYSLHMRREDALDRGGGGAETACPTMSSVGRLQVGTAACLWNPWGVLWCCSGKELSANGTIVLRAGQEEGAVTKAMGPPARTEQQALFYEWEPNQVLAVNLREGRIDSFCLSDSGWVGQFGGKYDPRTSDFPAGLHD